MDKVNRCTEELTAAIQTCRAYVQFEEAKERLKEYPELYTKVNQFRRKNYEMQSRKDDIDWFLEMENFEREHEELRRNPLVSEFLRTELHMCRMLQRINEAVAASVDLEIQDFADIIEW